MERNLAVILIREELRRWNECLGWRVRFTRSRRFLGKTIYTLRVVEFSGPFTDRAHTNELLDTVRHEAAHIIVGPGHGHDEVWQAACSRTGATPVEESSAPHGMGAYWEGYCACVLPRFGALIRRRTRPPADDMWCRSCNQAIDWVELERAEGTRDVESLRGSCGSA